MGFGREVGREVSKGDHREESLRRRSIGGRSQEWELEIPDRDREPQVHCRGSERVGGGRVVLRVEFRVGPENEGA